MSPRLGQLTELSLYVDDLDASKSFYQRLLGLDVLLEEHRMVGLELPGSAVLLLFDRSASGAQAGRLSPDALAFQDDSGARHVCLSVSEASLTDWERHLMVNGVVVEGRVAQSNGSVSLYFRDLDGHSLELATPGI